MNSIRIYFSSFFLLCFITSIQAQTTANWTLLKDEPTTQLVFTSSTTKQVKDYTFKAKWDDKLSYSENIGYYGGIAELKISKDNKELQSIRNIEDGIALGEIRFTFYDYNMDGHIDFTVPINCSNSCYDAYYLYNPETNTFEYQKDWDYLRIQKLDKKNKQILSQPEGTARDIEQKLYKVEGNNLQLIKKL
ncbi:XAC2610-related protein [Haloflavibacter putidus]|uniref:Uncharacterized protein n=1 Tax=Haloflavibacter putidus TaxID=2576776 RepID=A0A507ZK60_9FLAO|nr:hypothetical protein [Haloflavibacter putidus]TQD36248.1 hypothetical protein FKR84_10570 [Haloflavibacter putidus]